MKGSSWSDVYKIKKDPRNKVTTPSDNDANTDCDAPDLSELIVTDHADKYGLHEIDNEHIFVFCTNLHKE